MRANPIIHRAARRDRAAIALFLSHVLLQLHRKLPDRALACQFWSGDFISEKRSPAQFVILAKDVYMK